MTFETIEQSVESADPVYLYLFTIGNDEYRYTSAATDHDAMGYTWVSAPLESDGINLTDKLKQAEFTVTLPLQHQLSVLIMGYISAAVGLTVWSGYLSDIDEEYVVEWVGADCSPKPQGFECKLEFQSIFRMSQSNGLTPVFQRRCRHAVYSNNCGLSQDTWGVIAAIDSVAGKYITIPDAALQPAGEFIAGMIKTTSGVYQYIYNHAGDQVELFEENKALSAEVLNSGWDKNWGNAWDGAAVTLYPGCDGSLSRCQYFSNSDNHGGMPWLSDNPFNGSSIV